MRVFKYVILAVGVTALSACSSKFKTYDGPEVTRVVVEKQRRMMHLLHEDKVLKSYPVGLGFAPEGHKTREGDGKTPVGDYVINRRNPNSEFHLSIGISYPNANDIAQARALGVSPGGDIFIHGKPRKYRKAPQDWTAGCVAVTNRQMEEIYAMVRDGTPISLRH